MAVQAKRSGASAAVNTAQAKPAVDEGARMEEVPAAGDGPGAAQDASGAAATSMASAPKVSSVVPAVAAASNIISPGPDTEAEAAEPTDAAEQEAEMPAPKAANVRRDSKAAGKGSRNSAGKAAGSRVERSDTAAQANRAAAQAQPPAPAASKALRDSIASNVSIASSGEHKMTYM